ncbi:hypothetical protein [Massilia sp. Dwa41.01b]|uniref:hypothetical protein n=1 Tax=Massilia sp. Dwa41.01b TaxID=2709302 RepID=UPI001E38B632|nr:hypothetical protein [Massilia sp. Dwa41.01b]
MALSSTSGVLAGMAAASGWSCGLTSRVSPPSSSVVAAAAGARRVLPQPVSSSRSVVMTSSIASILAAVTRAISRWRSRSASFGRRDDLPERSASSGRVDASGASGSSVFFFRKENMPTSFPSSQAQSLRDAHP